MSKLPRRPVDLSEASLLPSQAQAKPFENRQQLYIMHFFFAFVSRMWDMGIVLLVAQLTNNSLYLVAITGLCCALSVFLFMGSIGHYLDRTNRIVAVRLALFSKVVAVTLAYMVCAYLNTAEEQAPTQDADILLRRQHLLYSLPLLGAIAGLSFCSITQSIEKDWIVVLSAKDTTWLSTTNSVMTQIDLACSSLAPALTGLMFAHASHESVSIILLLINALSALALYIYMSHLYNAWPALGQKVGVDVLNAADQLNTADIEDYSELSDDDISGREHPTYGAIHGNNESTTTAEGKPRLSVRSAAELTAKQSRRVSADAERLNQPATNAIAPATTTDGPCCGLLPCCTTSSCTTSCTSCTSFTDFLQSGCAGMMVAYAALYLTVLSFGSLMTVYIRWAGVPDDLLGLFRGLAALFGYTGAVIFPAVSKWLGLWEAAQWALLYQFSLVALAASSFFWAKDSVSVYIVMFAVLFSRTGLWLFDLCVRQIAQETIHETVRGKVNGQWRSMIAAFEMTGYAAAVYIPEPEHFWMLTTLSACMIGFALVVYTLTNPHNAWCVGGGKKGVAEPEETGRGVRVGGESYRAVATEEALPKKQGAAGQKPPQRRNGESLGGLEMQPGTNAGKNGRQ